MNRPWAFYLWLQNQRLEPKFVAQASILRTIEFILFTLLIILPGENHEISARNCLGGTIKAIEEGSVNNEVTIELAPGVELTSVVTKASCERLGLKVGDSAYALIKASSVMLGVDE